MLISASNLRPSPPVTSSMIQSSAPKGATKASAGGMFMEMVNVVDEGNLETAGQGCGACAFRSAYMNKLHVCVRVCVTERLKKIREGERRGDKQTDGRTDRNSGLRAQASTISHPYAHMPMESLKGPIAQKAIFRA